MKKTLWTGDEALERNGKANTQNLLLECRKPNICDRRRATYSYSRTDKMGRQNTSET
jgi:hypothetical protein